ncbi:glycine-rich domain-containing protein [Streptomyces sp. NPDC048330]|uniref:glycine-rich domain-containing protein n=1 Tax=Streptomyces sp. NPDC048330 TaxID=3365533 RepID=UPI003714F8C5
MTCQPQPGPTPCSSNPGAHGSNNPRTLLHDAALSSVVDNNPGMTPDIADRIVTEALKFVHAAALFPTIRIAPTRIVDEGWHALILHTHTYATLCSRLGRTVHHYPERPDTSRFGPTILTRTTALIEQAGYTPDPALWTSPDKQLTTVAAGCSHTQKPGGCGPINPGNCASSGEGQ